MMHFLRGSTESKNGGGAIKIHLISFVKKKAEGMIKVYATILYITTSQFRVNSNSSFVSINLSNCN